MQYQAFYRITLVILTTALLLGLTSPTFTVADPDRPRPEATTETTAAAPEGLSGDAWASIQEQIRQAEYHVTWQTLAGEDGAYRAPNRAQGFDVAFAPGGFSAASHEKGAAAWRFGLALTAYGDTALPAAVARQDLSADQATITYRWTDSVSE
jgi:hypothetical protein